MERYTFVQGLVRFGCAGPQNIYNVTRFFSKLLPLPHGGTQVMGCYGLGRGRLTLHFLLRKGAQRNLTLTFGYVAKFQLQRGKNYVFFLCRHEIVHQVSSQAERRFVLVSCPVAAKNVELRVDGIPPDGSLALE